MKVNEPPPVQPNRAVRPERSVPPPDQAGGSAGDGDSAADEHDEHGLEEDIAAVHGIDSDEYTPRVQEALADLIAEVASLREALAQSNKRLDYLTRLADQDSLSSLRNRRAFVRELSRALVAAKQRDVGSTLVFLEIDNLKEINVRRGMAAGDAAIEHVANILLAELGDSPVTGRLGGAEFGIILVGETEDGARRQSERLTEILRARPLVWDGHEIPLTVQWGLHSLLSSEDAAAAMNAADRDMRRAARQ